MFRVLVALSLFLSCVATPSTIVRDDRLKMISLEKKSVRINAVCDMDNQGRIGSGVVLGHKDGKTIVATANHVSDAIDKMDCDIVAYGWDGKSGYAKIIAADEANDVSVLEVDELLGRPAGLFDTPYLGQPLTCVGWPVIPHNVHSGKSITRGHVSTILDDTIRISADLYFGNSGGACYSTDGKVVGIVNSFVIGGQYLWLTVPFPGQYYLSHVDNLKKLLD